MTPQDPQRDFLQLMDPERTLCWDPRSMLGVLIEYRRGTGLGGDAVKRPHLYRLSDPTLRSALAAWHDTAAWTMWRRVSEERLGQGVRYYGEAQEALAGYLAATAAAPAGM